MIQESGWKVVEGLSKAFILDADDHAVATVASAPGEITWQRARVMAVAPEMARLLKQIMAAHRGQLPSECADLYGGGCGCSQCEQARALLARIEGGG